MDGFTDAQRRALEAARALPLSYVVRAVRAPDGRHVAILGEAHLKLARASDVGKAVVSAFELRGVETFQRDKVTWGRALGIVIHVPRAVLRAVSLGAVKDSTIVDARQLPSGFTVPIERAPRMPLALHVASVYMTCFFVVAFLAMALPLIAPVLPWLAAVVAALSFAFHVHLWLLVPGLFVRRRSWSWLVHPFLGILGPRDVLMAAGTVRMLEDHLAPRAAVVVMGRAHVSGYERLLVERYGFARVPIDAA
jgi:hypothetical protein